MASLIGISDIIKGEQFEVNKNRITIGRSHNNDIVLNHATVSAQHCYISHTGDDYIIHDLNSTNGTCISFKRNTSAKLKPKDAIQIGSLELVFDMESPEKKEFTPPADSNIVIEETRPIAKPESFSSVSPFGGHRGENKVVWIVLIVAGGFLALIGLIFFIYTIFR